MKKKHQVVVPARHVLADRPHVVCLCGSTRFKADFVRLNFELTMAGFIVLSVGFFGHDPDQSYVPTRMEKLALDRLHKEKIDLSDYVLIVDTDDYIGESTRSEIDYAMETAKPVLYASTKDAYGNHPWLPINPVINGQKATTPDIPQNRRKTRVSPSRGRVPE